MSYTINKQPNKYNACFADNYYKINPGIESIKKMYININTVYSSGDTANSTQYTLYNKEDYLYKFDISQILSSLTNIINLMPIEIVAIGGITECVFPIYTMDIIIPSITSGTTEQKVITNGSIYDSSLYFQSIWEGDRTYRLTKDRAVLITKNMNNNYERLRIKTYSGTTTHYQTGDYYLANTINSTIYDAFVYTPISPAALNRALIIDRDTTSVVYDDIITSATTYYTLNIEYYGDSMQYEQVGELISVNVDYDDYLYDHVSFVYLSKSGSYECLSLKGELREFNDVDREMYIKREHETSRISLTKKIYSIDTERSYEFSTDWLSDDTAKNIDDMLSSPRCAIIDDDTGLPIEIIFTNKSHEVKRKLNDQLISYDLEYIISEKEKLQNE